MKLAVMMCVKHVRRYKMQHAGLVNTARSVFIFAAASSYLGCFGDTGADRALPIELDRSSNNSVSNCRRLAMAAGYVYFGVQAGTECWATNDTINPFKYGPASCTVGCPQNATQICGGPWANAVYSTLGSILTTIKGKLHCNLCLHLGQETSRSRIDG